MLVATAVLAGCAIGPDYKRPSVAEPQTFRGQATAEAASLADAPWWEVFQDPALRNLIHEALRNNYDVRIAAARVQEARAGFVATRSDLFPSLNYDASVGRSNATPGLLGKPGRQAPITSNFYSATLVGDRVILIGRLGYMCERHPGVTPVITSCQPSTSIPGAPVGYGFCTEPGPVRGTAVGVGAGANDARGSGVGLGCVRIDGIT